MRRRVLSTLSQIGFLFLLAISVAHSAGERVVITGSSTVAPLILEIGKRFEKTYPGVRVDVQTGGSSRGMADVRSGVADIGMVSRALKANEHDLTAFPVAYDGIGMIVHRDNKAVSLSDEQIKAIYKGEIKNWRDVGGDDAPITVVNKAEGRSTLELFVQHFAMKNSEIKARVVIGDNQQGIKTVAGNPGAIGYVSVGAAEFEVSQGTSIKLLPLQGVVASVDSVRTGAFPLSRPLNLVTRAPPQGIVKQFIEYAQSNKVDDLVEQQFYVTLTR